MCRYVSIYLSRSLSLSLSLTALQPFSVLSPRTTHAAFRFEAKSERAEVKPWSLKTISAELASEYIVLSLLVMQVIHESRMYAL